MCVVVIHTNSSSLLISHLIHTHSFNPYMMFTFLIYTNQMRCRLCTFINQLLTTCSPRVGLLEPPMLERLLRREPLLRVAS